MANWTTHMMIADRLMEILPDIDRRGFAAGNIAPDCNVENADWTQFTPPRAVTHRMTGEDKDSADCEGFFDEYIRGKKYSSAEEKAYVLGYYCHLVTDREFQKFFWAPEISEARFARLKADPEYRGRIAGMPENRETLRRVFTKKERLSDQTAIEREYILKNPGSAYKTALPFIGDFPDYLNILPPGAIGRKIPIMLAADAAAEATGRYIFITPEEHAGYVGRTLEILCGRLKEAMP